MRKLNIDHSDASPEKVKRKKRRAALLKLGSLTIFAFIVWIFSSLHM